MKLPNITILDESDKRLRKKSQEVTFPLNDTQRQTINNMITYLTMSQIKETQEKYHLRAGWGLSAVQVGLLERIFVIVEEIEKETFKHYIVINPKILSHSEEKIYVGEGEGCLSVNRDVVGIVPRYARITISAYDMDGKPYEIRVREDVAIAFQHELDHLNGILFVDYINKKNPFQGKELMREI